MRPFTKIFLAFVTTLIFFPLAEARTRNSTAAQISNYIIKLYGTFRLSHEYSELYKACLRKDKDWFLNSNSQLESFDFCEEQLAFFRENIGRRLPVLRESLAIGQYEFFGDNQPVFTPQNSHSIDQVRGKLSPTITHLYKGFANLTPLTEKEMNRAAERVRQDVIQRNLWLKQQPIEVRRPTTPCVLNSSLPYIFAGSSCYLEISRSMIFGNPDRGLKPVPLLAFLTSADPTDKEIIHAIEKVQERNKKVRENFEKKYFNKLQNGEFEIKKTKWTISNNLDLFLFQSFAEKYIKKNPNFDWIYKKAQEKITQNIWLKTGMEMGIGVAIYLGCHLISQKTKRFIRLGCAAPLMAGNLSTFLIFDHAILNHLIDISLYRPDGFRSVGKPLGLLNHLDFQLQMRQSIFPYTLGLPAKVLFGLAGSNRIIDY